MGMGDIHIFATGMVCGMVIVAGLVYVTINPPSRK
jgi:hypothetical protein